MEKGNLIWEMAQEAFKRAIRAGVRHACGTDAGTPHNPHGSAPAEVERMVEWGLPSASALSAATANAAQLLRSPSIGTVERGKDADLALWPGEVLDDVSLLRAPALVMRRGLAVGGSLL